MQRLLERAVVAKSSQAIEAARIERDVLESSRRTEELRAKWNAPMRHAVARPPREGAWGEKLSALESRLGRGFLVALVGGRGTGKTQMAVELMKSVTRAGRPALFRTALELVMHFKVAYRKDAVASELDVLRVHRRPSLLVIDEISRRGETEWENNVLFELLNERYGDMTDSVLVCNQCLAELETSLGPSLVSRMQETGGVIECDWPSFRNSRRL